MSNLKNNTLTIHISIDPDAEMLDVQMEHNLSPRLPQDQADFYIDMLNGIGFKIDAEAEGLAFQGSLLRKLGELRALVDELDGEELAFEPDEELLEKIKEAKSDNVISIKDKLH